MNDRSKSRDVLAGRGTATSNSFTIERTGSEICGSAVTVELEPWMLKVQSDGARDELVPMSDGKALLRIITSRLWGTGNVARQPPPQAVADIVEKERRRIAATAPREVVAVQQVIMRETAQSAWIAGTEEFYRERFLVRDVLNYRAAAVAMAYFDRLWRPPRRRTSDEPLLRRDVIAAAANWRGLFSPSGTSYTSLDRTLMRLPRGVSAARLCRLSRVRLPRPIVARLELMTVCAWANIRITRGRGAATSMDKIILHAPADEIAAAVGRIGQCTRRQLSTEKAADLDVALRFIADYPEPYEGRLPGLVARAVRWHDAVRTRTADARLRDASLDPAVHSRESLTKRPNIRLPESDAIRFLGTVGDVFDEGARMHHCVAIRAGEAVEGRAHIFHVDWKGQAATIQVSPDGKLVESAGPCNSMNEACTWGAREIGRWFSTGVSGARA